MDFLTTFIGGLGIIGILVFFILGGALLAILPIWAIIDCSNSNREPSKKTMIIVFLCLTWGIGSLIYSAFFTESKTLRRFCLVSIISLLALFVLSVGSCVHGCQGLSKLQEKRAIEQKVEDEKFLQNVRARGFSNIIKGQSLSIEKEITTPTFFDAQVFKLMGDSASDIFVKAQVCEIYGTVKGNLIFKGQTLTIQPKAVIEGNLEADAQVLERYGKVMGNTSGTFQVIKE